MVGDSFGILGTVQAEAFRVDSVVAEGGFAVVYRAHHQQFRADVALKCLKVPGTLSHEQREEFLERFRAEAELLFRLSSALSCVVRPLHVGELTLSDDRFAPFIALEWLEGQTLATQVEERWRLSKPPLTIREMVTFMAPVARALERAHAFPGPEGPVAVLHRDLKPENVFVAEVHEEQVLKILDFGIAKVKGAATQIVGHVSVDQTGLSAFTPAYAAPEQWLPKRFGQTGTWTDVWGLALTALETVYGHPPLEGDMAAIMGAAIDTTLRPTPRNEGIEVSDKVEAVFHKALAVDPKERYASVGEFWDDLERHVGVSMPVKVTRIGEQESLPPAAIASAERQFVPSLPSLIQPEVPEVNPAASTEGTTDYGELDFDMDDDMGADLPHRQPLEVDDSAASAAAAPPQQKQKRPSPASPHPAASDAATRTPVDSDSARGALAHRNKVHPGMRDFEDVGIMPMPDVAINVPARPRRPMEPSWRPSSTGYSLARRVSGPLKLLAFALVIMGADWLYTINTGEIVSAGPLRPLWVAGPLGVIALSMIIYAVLSSE